MQAVAHKIPARSYHWYVKAYDVPGKIARHLADGTFHQVIELEAKRAGVKPRKMRTPGTLARLRSCWPAAANDAHHTAARNTEPTTSAACVASTSAITSLSCSPSSV